ASMPPEAAVISTVIFCRAWISGKVSHFTFIPVSDSNSGMFFSSTSMNGCLVRSRKSSLPWKRFQLKPWARAGVKTNGPAATPAVRPCRKARRVRRRAGVRHLLSTGGGIARGGLTPGDTVAPFGCRLKSTARPLLLFFPRAAPAADHPRRQFMRYRAFGRTGLRVSVLGFGCWPMAGDRYGAIEDSEAIKAIHRALDRGVNCVDTAPAYGGGHSEEVVARALEKTRRDVILVTKCGVKPPPPGQLGPLRDASRTNIMREIDLSLQRLHTDWVDVLLVHWPDASTPFEETMRALEEVVASGRVRFVGVSNFTGAMMAECLKTRRIDVSQVGYHMFDRRQEQETFPSCLSNGI